MTKILIKLFCAILFFSLIYSSFHSDNAKASGFYVSGVTGSSINLDSRIKKPSFAFALGYALPLLLKTEVTYRNIESSSFASAGARLTIFPFLNLNAGLAHRFQYQDKKDNNGYYGGLGFNFNLLPVFDIIADATYIHLTKDHYALGEIGLRYHF